MNVPRFPRQATTTETIAVTREVVDELTQVSPLMPERVRNRGAAQPDIQKHTRRETLTIAIQLVTTIGSPSDVPPGVN